MSEIQPDKSEQFHGYSIMPAQTIIGACPNGNTAIQLHIGKLPERKGLCLYMAETNRFTAQITPLAYFKTQESAQQCQRVLDWMILKIQPA
jgi:hypothetical protein